MQPTIKERNAIQFKGKMFSLNVLSICSDDLQLLQAQIEKTIAQAPKMFLYAPIAIDLEEVGEIEIQQFLPALIDLLKQFKMMPVALTGGTLEQQQAALRLGFAVLPASKQATAPVTNSAVSSAAPAAAKPKTVAANATRIIDHPIRSGQQVYAENADLIVLAAVSHGAEIIADGNIHVYGALHGRAIAGAAGDQNARIFCHKLDAELVSIAGIYLLRDGEKNKQFEAPMQILLKDNRLLMMEL